MTAAVLIIVVSITASCSSESEPAATPRPTVNAYPATQQDTSPTAVPTQASVELSGPASTVAIGNKLGERVPDFSIMLSDGSVVRSSEILAEGKPVFLFFWATWCSVCKGELQSILKAYPEYEDSVTFYAVGQDPTESIGALTLITADRGYHWPVASAGPGMLRSLNILSQSSKLAFDGNGVITYRDGYGNGDVNTWRRVFEELVASN